MAKRKSKPKAQSSRPSRDLNSVIKAYLSDYPDTQYHEMLAVLHARGYAINRHGNKTLMAIFMSAQKLARRK